MKKKHLSLKKRKIWLKLYRIYFFKKNSKKYGPNRIILFKKFSQFFNKFKNLLTPQTRYSTVSLSLVGGKYWRSSYFYDKFFLKHKSLDLKEFFFFKKKFNYSKKSNDFVLFKFFVLYSKYFTLITHKFKHTENLKKKKIKSYFLNLIKINQKNLNLLVLSKLIITFS